MTAEETGSGQLVLADADTKLVLAGADTNAVGDQEIVLKEEPVDGEPVHAARLAKVDRVFKWAKTFGQDMADGYDGMYREFRKPVHTMKLEESMYSAYVAGEKQRQSIILFMYLAYEFRRDTVDADLTFTQHVADVQQHLFRNAVTEDDQLMIKHLNSAAKGYNCNTNQTPIVFFSMFEKFGRFPSASHMNQIFSSLTSLQFLVEKSEVALPPDKPWASTKQLTPPLAKALFEDLLAVMPHLFADPALLNEALVWCGCTRSTRTRLTKAKEYLPEQFRERWLALKVGGPEELALMRELRHYDVLFTTPVLKAIDAQAQEKVLLAVGYQSYIYVSARCKRNYEISSKSPSSVRWKNNRLQLILEYTLWLLDKDEFKEQLEQDLLAGGVVRDALKVVTRPPDHMAKLKAFLSKNMAHTKAVAAALGAKDKAAEEKKKAAEAAKVAAAAAQQAARDARVGSLRATTRAQSASVPEESEKEPKKKKESAEKPKKKKEPKERSKKRTKKRSKKGGKRKKTRKTKRKKSSRSRKSSKKEADAETDDEETEDEVVALPLNQTVVAVARKRKDPSKLTAFRIPPTARHERAVQYLRDLKQIAPFGPGEDIQLMLMNSMYKEFLHSVTNGDPLVNTADLDLAKKRREKVHKASKMRAAQYQDALEQKDKEIARLQHMLANERKKRRYQPGASPPPGRPAKRARVDPNAMVME